MSDLFTHKQTKRVAVRTVCMALCLSWSGICLCSEPELKVASDPQAAHPGRDYRITCDVSWTGGAADFAVFPAEFDAIDWGSIAVTQAIGSVCDGANVVSQTIVVRPDKPGEFKTPEIRIPYARPEELKPPAQQGPPAAPDNQPKDRLTLKADPFSLSVKAPRKWLWVPGVAGALALCVAAGWVLLRRKRAAKATAPLTAGSEFSAQGVQSALQTARQRRIEGRHYEFYQELCRGADMLGAESSDLAERLKGYTQKVGYRGLRPTADEMDGHYRDVERALKRRTEETNG